MEKLPEVYTVDTELTHKMVSDFMQWCHEQNVRAAKKGFYLNDEGPALREFYGSKVGSA